MSPKTPGPLDDNFLREAELFGLEERKPYSLQERETDEQRDLSRRWVESYKHGLEEVNIWQRLEGLTHPEVHHMAMGIEALMLSSFCRGQCQECGLCAAPYTQENRQIFELEPLIRFLEKYRMGGALGKVMLYDASDPLDYPYLLQLLDYLEWDDNYREVKVVTACPTGTEELLEHVLQRGSEKIQFGLSVLPSTEGRLKKSGAWDTIIEDTRRKMEESPHGAWGIPRGWKYTMPNSVGKIHHEGGFSHGFYCGDMMVMTPHLGPCCGEYHVASDLYPTERRLVPVSESRKVYFHNEFFSVQFKDGFGGDHQPRIYTPHSDYTDLDTGEWHKEVALRHLAAFIYYALSNMQQRKGYSQSMEIHLGEIYEALKAGNFVLPDDYKELAFYRKMIPELLNYDPNSDPLAGREFFGAVITPGINPMDGHKRLWGMIGQVVKEFQEVILGADRNLAEDVR